MQTKRLLTQLDRLNNEISFIESVIAILPERLKPLALLVETSLYGSGGSLLFKAERISLKALMSYFEVVKTQKWNGKFRYLIPATYDLLERDPHAVKTSEGDLVADYTNMGFSLAFYGLLGGRLFEVSLDYTQLIIGNKYPSLATGMKLPHLILNPNFTKNGFNGCQYIGVNGAPNTNNYSAYQLFSTEAALELVERK